MKHQIQHVKINNEIFFLKVASTPTELNNGLMYIKDLDDNTGMLFVFPNENGIRCPYLAKFVIETKAGAIDRYDIEPGDKVYFLN